MSYLQWKKWWTIYVKYESLKPSVNGKFDNSTADIFIMVLILLKHKASQHYGNLMAKIEKWFKEKLFFVNSINEIGIRIKDLFKIT